MPGALPAVGVANEFGRAIRDEFDEPGERQLDHGSLGDKSPRASLVFSGRKRPV